MTKACKHPPWQAELDEIDRRCREAVAREKQRVIDETPHEIKQVRERMFP